MSGLWRPTLADTVLKFRARPGHQETARPDASHAGAPVPRVWCRPGRVPYSNFGPQPPRERPAGRRHHCSGRHPTLESGSTGQVPNPGGYPTETRVRPGTWKSSERRSSTAVNGLAPGSPACPLRGLPSEPRVLVGSASLPLGGYRSARLAPPWHPQGWPDREGWTATSTQPPNASWGYGVDPREIPTLRGGW